MGIAFETPLALLLLVPLLAVTFALYLSARRRVGVGRRRTALIVRTLLLSSLVLASRVADRVGQVHDEHRGQPVDRQDEAEPGQGEHERAEQDGPDDERRPAPRPRRSSRVRRSNW